MMGPKTVPNLILFCIFLNCLTSAQECCEEYCYAIDADRSQIKKYATKTAYEAVRGLDTDRQYIVPDCEPSKFWLLSRHGTRLPGAKSMKDLRELSSLRDSILDNYEKRKSRPDKGRLCADDLDLLRDWKWDTNITEEYDQFLTVSGWNELKFLALRYQKKYSDVLSKFYSRNRYLFRHSGKQRTEASFRAFAEGLFGENGYLNIHIPEVIGNDTLLRPYEYCPAYQDNKIDIPTSEFSKFSNTSIFKAAVQDISTRLGFRYTLKEKQIISMWDMCRFEQAWFISQVSPWCAAFTKQQVEVLEYKEDLKYYYQNGYGTKLNSKVACHAVADMLRHLETGNDPLAVEYFTHETQIQLFLTALGAAEDTDSLRADNFDQMKRREWRSSALTPFAGNVAVVKYQCNSAVEPHKVMFFLNEKPLRFNWCNIGLCNLSDVLTKYKYYKEADCSKEYCGFGSSSQIMPSIILSIFVTFVVTIAKIF